MAPSICGFKRAQGPAFNRLDLAHRSCGRAML